MTKIFTLFISALFVLNVHSQTYHPLATSNFFQDWTNTGLITANDDWTGVPSIIGYRGDDVTTIIGASPDTVLGLGTSTIDVIANQTNPNTQTSGGVAEFEITNPTVALQGSATADAPHLTVFLNTTNASNINFSFLARDIDGSADNAVQSIAVQYRVGNTGPFLYIPNTLILDASTGPDLATQETQVNFVLPAGANNQPMVEVRILTINAAGSDEWIGIDNISVTQGALPLSLTAFNASLNSDAVQLNWTSLNEQGVYSFVVERSTDGRTYSAIGQLSANNASRSSYAFADRNPSNGTNYYRLRMTDKDGIVKYSSVVIISNRKGLTTQVFPNPAFGNISVSHSKAIKGAAIRILNAEGKQIKTYAVEVGAIQTSLTVGELLKGNYILVFDNDGERSTSKFIKQ